MQNRKNLHDYGLVLIILGILHLFTFVATVIASIVDGSTAAALATVEPSILVATKVVLGIIGALMTLLVFADVLIGIKALKVSRNPNTDKGYIIAAKVFFVMSIIAAVSHAVSMFDGSAPIVDAILNFVSAALGAVVYFIFVKAALAVRNDVINGAK